MRYSFTVYGKVRGQGRPRTTKTGHVYKAEADRDYERRIKEAYINGNGPHFGGAPVSMRVDVYRSLPQSAPKKVTSEPDTKKPDCTNVAKAVEDALNGIAYYDDAQITRIECVKHDRERLENERIEVTISEV